MNHEFTLEGQARLKAPRVPLNTALLIGCALFLGALFGGQFRYPIEHAVGIGNPPAVPAVGCPAGWDPDVSGDDALAHTQTSCSRGGITVYLNSEGHFWKALIPGAAEFESDPTKVSGWE